MGRSPQPGQPCVREFAHKKEPVWGILRPLQFAGRVRVEKGTVVGGTVQAYCAGHPGYIIELRQIALGVLITCPGVTGPSIGSA